MSRTSLLTPALRGRLLTARLQQLLGWPGLAGLALLVLALGLSAVAWSAREAARTAPADLVQAVDRERAKRLDPAPPTPQKSLPTRAQIETLLSQVQESAVASGLGWPAAEYRLSPASETVAASLEVRCTLKGTYPQFRGLLTRLLAEVPGLTVRELSIRRVGSDVPEVEAKLVLAIFLQGDALALPGKAVP